MYARRIKTILLSLIFFVTNVSLASEHHPEEFLASIQGSSDAGKQIYDHFCATCHAAKPLIAIGAPCIGVKADWEPYSKQTPDQMVKIIDAGIGAMPSRGGCFECSDDDLKAAIIYMLPKS